MSAFNSNWTPAVFWTQPSSIRVDGNQSFDSHIDVYPNPTRDYLFISIKEILNNKIDIILINNLGENIPLISNLSEDQYTLNLSNYPKGLYTLKVIIDNQSYFKKIIVQ